MYLTPTSRYSVHRAFAGSFLFDGFIIEQHGKLELTKQIERTTGTLEEMKGWIPSMCTDFRTAVL